MNSAIGHLEIASPLGLLTLLASEGALIGVYFEQHKGKPQHLGDVWPQNPVLLAAEQQLHEYFAGERRVFDLPLAPQGSDFQLRVWQLLREIPYGETCSYVELAERLGSASATRAVATANARNPLSIIVPCHRVLGSDGALRGYAGGIAAKRHLLRLESDVRLRDDPASLLRNG